MHVAGVGKQLLQGLSNLAALAGAVVRMPLVELHGQCLLRPDASSAV